MRRTQDSRRRAPPYRASDYRWSPWRHIRRGRNDRKKLSHCPEMARAGGRDVRVLSSGRLPLRPLTYKKRGPVRKSSTTSVDSGYSLCSTDSEDQVLDINRGLDRCAALLHDLLRCDVEGDQLKPHKVPGTKGIVRSSTMKTKKSAVRRPTTATHVHKEKGPLRRNVAPGLCNAGAQGPRGTSPPLPSHNSDHVTTQMQRLNRVSSPVTGAVPPPPGPEASAQYNCRLPTSTPTLSPQHPADPRSASDPDFLQTLPPGGITQCLPSMPASSAFSMAGSIRAPALHDAAVPTGYQAAHHANALGSYTGLIQDSAVLRCMAAHLAQLQQSEVHLHNQAAACTEGPPTESEEEAAAGTAPVPEIRCHTSSSKQQKTPQKTEKKIQTLEHLLGDIKSLVADRGEEKVKRLVTELEHRTSLLPAAASDINVHAEVALALQPLRSENAQLRRRLRILSQQLRDQERGARCEERSSEVTSLQSMNETLQHQLSESQKRLESLQSQHRELLTAMEAQKDEAQRTAHIIQEKERDIGRMSEQSDATSARMRKEVDEATASMKAVHFKLEASEKENQILGIALRQRDAEVARLRERTRTLQASMAKLLCDLNTDGPKPNAGSRLTRAALGSYDHQLQSTEGPASTSILNYLKRLETDQVLTGPDPIYPDRPLLPTSSQVNGEKGVMAEVSEDSRIGHTHNPNGGPPRARPYSPREPKELGNELLYLTSTEPRPDDTVYLPLVSSPCKHDAPLRQMCTPPTVYSVERDRGSGYQGDGHNPHVSDLASETHQHDHKSAPRIPRPSHPAPVLPQRRSLQVRGGPPSERSVCEGQPDWSVCSFSTFTSHDEQDFRNGLAALDANIAELQRTLQRGSSR